MASPATPNPPSQISSTSSPAETTVEPYSYSSSKIVKTAIAAGVIVLACTALVLFFKISSWVRYRQRLSRQSHLTTLLQSEQRANAFEIAAWSDEPGMVPMKGIGGDKKSRKQKKEEIRAFKRGGANAHAIHEWEGVAA